jgi:hypothetical protein
MPSPPTCDLCTKPADVRCSLCGEWLCHRCACTLALPDPRQTVIRASCLGCEGREAAVFLAPVAEA